MFVLPTAKTPVLFQGITSEMGLKHLQIALEYGTNIVAGISQESHIKNLLGVPVFNKVKQAVQKFHPKVTVIFSTPAHALDDVIQAANAKIPLIICTTEHVPMHDALKMKMIAQKNKVQLLGPSSNGIISAKESVVGTLPVSLFQKGNIAIIGRSSSLIYESIYQLSNLGLGVSKCITLGTDHLIGMDFIPIIQCLLQDKSIRAILIIGQVHGQLEQKLSAFLKKNKTQKKIFAYIPGNSLKKSDKRPLLGMKSVLFADIIASKKEQFKQAHVIYINQSNEIGKIIAQKLTNKKGKK